MQRKLTSKEIKDLRDHILRFKGVGLVTIHTSEILSILDEYERMARQVIDLTEQRDVYSNMVAEAKL